ncbi:MAG: hypothetical protein Tsb0010_05180 [Parvularculaceae bacterium]
MNMRSGLPLRLWSAIRSIAFKIVLIMIVFLLVPFAIYSQFGQLDREKSAFLRDSIQRESRLILEALTPLLDEFETSSPGELQAALDALYDPPRNVKLLFSLADDGAATNFFYIASSPPVTRENARIELENLLAASGLADAAASCQVAAPLAREFTNAQGQAEVLASLAPYRSGPRCWMVLTSYDLEQIPNATFLRPVWRDPSIVLATGGYLAVAALIGWLLFDIWDDVRSFGRAARNMRKRGASAMSFAALTRSPELIPIAQEIDRLVEAIHQSKEFIRQAAEENAHSFKTPLAVITQALEPLKRHLEELDPRSRRSLELIEISVKRIDNLISVARDIETQAAESIEPTKDRVDIAPILAGLAADYRRSLQERRISIELESADSLNAVGNESLLGVAFENVIDNAASFAPEGSSIRIVAARQGQEAVITISDEGEGAPPEQIENIFDRYVSHRERIGEAGDATSGKSYGIGLWIVRRNIESLGGAVFARNLSPRGFELEIRLIAA